MSAHDHRETFGRTRLSFADEKDIDDFVATLDRFERGEITPDQWRAFRLVRGTYGQRQNGDFQMQRVKIPQGMLDATQLEALADVAEQYSRGFGHITTRQNIQFHFVKLHEVEHLMRRLAETGLTTREACGNSVRNITACPYAGVSADEIFDVTPYAEALTRYLLRHPLSSSLPRKFKIAFEGCREDHIATAINDIGWRARIRQAPDGRTERGFLVTVAGGTSTLSRAGQLLYDFLPAAEMLVVAEAIVRVFHRLGDYQHKQRNRLKFLVQSLGWERFKQEFERELEGARTLETTQLPFDPEHPPIEEEPRTAVRPRPSTETIAARVGATVLIGPGIYPRVEPRTHVGLGDFARWRRTNVIRQKQEGYSIAVITTVLGDLTAAQFRLIGELAQAYGDGAVRVTADQNVVLRWVRASDLEELHRRLNAASLGRPGANTLADVTSCPGAESCRLAVTQSRGLGRLLVDGLEQRPDIVAAAPDLHIKISGCPNGCGQHHVAGIGFQGSLRKVGGRPAPHYFVMIGGGTDDDGTTFGRRVATVPARRSLEVVERLTGLYRSQRADGETPLTFFRRVDAAVVKSALSELEVLAADTAPPDAFIDLAESQAFEPEILEGECSA
jgi:sulfite reductase (NADPH) hemoprotein beta-component